MDGPSSASSIPAFPPNPQLQKPPSVLTTRATSSRANRIVELTTAASQPGNFPLVSRGLQLLAITQLRQLLREYSLPTGGNKLTLVTRLVMYLETFGTRQESFLVQFSVKLRKFLASEEPGAGPDDPEDFPETTPDDISRMIFQNAPSCLYDLTCDPFVFGPVPVPARWPSAILVVAQIEIPDDRLPFLDFAAADTHAPLQKVILTVNDEYVALTDHHFLHPLPALGKGEVAIQVQSADPDQPLVFGIRWFRKVTIEEVVKRTVEGPRAADPPVERPTMSGICPFSRRVITCPTRGVQCGHWQCFDLMPWIIAGAHTNSWSCPICHLPIKSNELRFDPQFLMNITG
jgi:hypothetical protein